jgi:hypothetical protein
MRHSAKKTIGRKAERPGTKDCQFDSARPKTFLLTSFLLNSADGFGRCAIPNTTAKGSTYSVTTDRRGKLCRSKEME